MKSKGFIRKLPREQIRQLGALGGLLLLTGLAIAGPTGLLAWSENASRLEQRQAQIAQLTSQRDELRNRVALLDPEGADPDLVSEYIRRNLNLVQEDEVVLTLDDEQTADGQ